MGRATAGVLELMGVSVRRVEQADDVQPIVEAALDDAFVSNQSVAVLLSQRMLGRKKWTQ
jgi:sulfopyruvate decarboxylase TPP-binding subunit